MQTLFDFASRQSSMALEVKGFSSFHPHTIYIRVLESPELLQLQSELCKVLVETGYLAATRNLSRPFIPHMTVAFRDLGPNNFQTAWAEFSQKLFSSQFSVEQLSLLVYSPERHWQIDTEFGFATEPLSQSQLRT